MLPEYIALWAFFDHVILNPSDLQGSLGPRITYVVLSGPIFCAMLALLGG
jgi:hypothetical protein